jgi:mevalonate kinase
MGLIRPAYLLSLLMAAISRSAPGKLILSGEHAVVYQQPAIAIPLKQIHTTISILALPRTVKGAIRMIAPQISLDTDLTALPETHPLRRSIDLIQEFHKLDHFPACEIHISSNIPVGSGLGSSASSSVSLIRALSDFIGHPLNDDAVNQLAFEMEKIHHGNPSGIDNTVVTFGKPIYFIRNQPIEFIKTVNPLEFLIANTGIKASTVQAVTRVKTLREKNPHKYDPLFTEIGIITNNIRTGLLTGDIEKIGRLLTENHRYLQEISVSCPELDRLVEAALKAGAFGAKLTGGGLGGNMLALVNLTEKDNVEKSLLEAGATSVLHATLSPEIEGKK